jgi:hypothetical protein
MKKFIIYWDETFITEKVEIVDSTFFKSSNGFDIVDAGYIDRLFVGETITVNNHVIILRVK